MARAFTYEVPAGPTPTPTSLALTPPYVCNQRNELSFSYSVSQKKDVHVFILCISEEVPLREEPLHELMAVYCCENECLYNCVTKMPRETEMARNMFKLKTRKEQSDYVHSYLMTHSTKTQKGYDFKYLIGTRPVCPDAWQCILGLSRSRYYRIRKKFIGE